MKYLHLTAAAATVIAFATSSVSASPKHHSNGQIISLKSIHLTTTSQNLRTYKMMYWSAGTPTEAFVAVPKQVGAFPLWVECHGGWAVPEPFGHSGVLTRQDNQTWDENMLNGALSNSITVVPMYRGYGASGGHVGGLDADTLDTQNAIRAAMIRFPVASGRVLLTGTSMGGAVVLNVAAQRGDVLRTIAVSPFAGWDIVGSWAQTHPSNQVGLRLFNLMLKSYGTFKPSSPTYKRVSIHYQTIESPVLLVQGTADNRVPWQTVRKLYHAMQEANIDVQFDLVRGGNHGLANQPKTLHEDIITWLNTNV